jgi:hemoglobin-like flavoprotein
MSIDVTGACDTEGAPIPHDRMVPMDGARKQFLFVVRIWQEQNTVAPDQEWRGSLEHAAGGRRRYFRNFRDLSRLLAVEVGEEVEPVAQGGPGLTAGQILLVQASFTALLPQLDALVASFYQRLFALHPELEQHFRGEPAVHRQQFSAMLMVLVEELHASGKIDPLLERLGQRHRSYGALPRHYPMVGETLIATLREAHGADFSPALETAWRAAYDRLASVMLAGDAMPG